MTLNNLIIKDIYATNINTLNITSVYIGVENLTSKNIISHTNVSILNTCYTDTINNKNITVINNLYISKSSRINYCEIIDLNNDDEDNILDNQLLTKRTFERTVYDNVSTFKSDTTCMGTIYVVSNSIFNNTVIAANDITITDLNSNIINTTNISAQSLNLINNTAIAIINTIDSKIISTNNLFTNTLNFTNLYQIIPNIQSINLTGNDLISNNITCSILSVISISSNNITTTTLSAIDLDVQSISINNYLYANSVIQSNISTDSLIVKNITCKGNLILNNMQFDNINCDILNTTTLNITTCNLDYLIGKQIETNNLIINEPLTINIANTNNFINKQINTNNIHNSILTVNNIITVDSITCSNITAATIINSYNITSNTLLTTLLYTTNITVNNLSTDKLAANNLIINTLSCNNIIGYTLLNTALINNLEMTCDNITMDNVFGNDIIANNNITCNKITSFIINNNNNVTCNNIYISDIEINNDVNVLSNYNANNAFISNKTILNNLYVSANSFIDSCNISNTLHNNIITSNNIICDTIITTTLNFITANTVFNDLYVNKNISITSGNFSDINTINISTNTANISNITNITFNCTHLTIVNNLTIGATLTISGITNISNIITSQTALLTNITNLNNLLIYNDLLNNNNNIFSKNIIVNNATFNNITLLNSNTFNNLEVKNNISCRTFNSNNLITTAITGLNNRFNNITTNSCTIDIITCNNNLILDNVKTFSINSFVDIDAAESNLPFWNLYYLTDNVLRIRIHRTAPVINFWTSSTLVNVKSPYDVYSNIKSVTSHTGFTYLTPFMYPSSIIVKDSSDTSISLSDGILTDEGTYTVQYELYDYFYNKSLQSITYVVPSLSFNPFIITISSLNRPYTYKGPPPTFSGAPRYDGKKTYEIGINDSNIYWSYDMGVKDAYPIIYPPNIASSASTLATGTPTSFDNFITSSSSLGTSIVFRFGPTNSPPYSSLFMSIEQNYNYYFGRYRYYFAGKGWTLSKSFFDSVDTTNTFNAIFKLRKFEKCAFRITLNAHMYDTGANTAIYYDYILTNPDGSKRTFATGGPFCNGTILLKFENNKIILQQVVQKNFSTIQPVYTGPDANTVSGALDGEKTFTYKPEFETTLQNGFFLSIYKSSETKSYIEDGISKIVFYYEIKFYDSNGTLRISLSLPYTQEQSAIPFVFFDGWTDPAAVNNYMITYEGFYWTQTETLLSSTFINTFPNKNIF